MSKRLMTWLTRFSLVFALAFALLSVSALADTGILVEYPNGTADTFCLRTENKLSGYDLLQKSKFYTEWSGSSAFGRLLCKIDGVGTKVKGSSCEFKGDFWGFYISSPSSGGGWEFSPVGLVSSGGCWDGSFSSFNGHYCSQQGDLIGLKFGDGSGKPAPSSLEDVCRQYLEIEKVVAEVSGKRKTVSESVMIRNVKPASLLAFDVRLQNNGDGAFSKVEIDLVVKGLDMDFSESVGGLGPGDEDEVSFEEEVPVDADEGTYPALILIRGTDPLGQVHTARRAFSIDIERERHELSITEARAQQVVVCLGEMSVFFTVENYGRSTEKEAHINISGVGSIPGIAFSVDSSSAYSSSIRVPFTESENQGTKTLHLAVYDSKGKLNDEQDILTYYSGCEKAEANVVKPASSEDADASAEGAAEAAATVTGLVVNAAAPSPSASAEAKNTKSTRLILLAVLAAYSAAILLAAAIIMIFRK